MKLLILLLILLSTPLRATTGLFNRLPLSDFNALAPDGLLFHFRDRGATQMVPAFTLQGAFDGLVSTGSDIRTHLQLLFDTVGEPCATDQDPTDTCIFGIFISGASQQPHFVLPRHLFPSQTGAMSQRAGKLQVAIDDAMQFTYEVFGLKDEQGNPIQAFHFIMASHVFTYQSDSTDYLSGCEPEGDYLFGQFNRGNPPGNWWQVVCAQ